MFSHLVEKTVIDLQDCVHNLSPLFVLWNLSLRARNKFLTHRLSNLLIVIRISLKTGVYNGKK